VPDTAKCGEIPDLGGIANGGGMFGVALDRTERSALT
jgi:hypothetical protein